MDFDPPELSDETKAKLSVAQDAADKEFEQDPELEAAVLEADGIRAGYKIEIMFGPRRTTNGPNVCLVQLWESGKHFHGGGDSLMYTCINTKKLDQKTTKDVLLGLHKNPEFFAGFGGCGKAIPGNSMASGIAFCPHCKKGINAKLLTHLLPFENTTAELSEVLALIFRQLKDNADLYSKFFRDDIRYQASLRAYGEEKGRKLRGLSIYPLKNIMKDLAAGAALETKFRAFLSA